MQENYQEIIRAKFASAIASSLDASAFDNEKSDSLRIKSLDNKILKYIS